ncbi:Transmembrane protein 87A [Balamuthia mandrillaris]
MMKRREGGPSGIRCSGMVWWVVAVALLLLQGCTTRVEGGIFRYDEVTLRTGVIRFEREAMWSLEDSPMGSDSPYATFNMTFTKANAGVVGGHTEFLFFNADRLEDVGLLWHGRRYYCCTATLRDGGHCRHVGRLLLPTHTNNTIDFWYTYLPFGQSRTITYNQTISIAESDVYYAYFVNCGQSNAGQLLMSGDIVWKNPYGYLPGDDLGFLPFYVLLTALYGVLLLLWLLPTIRYRQKLLPLQHTLTGVLVLGQLESFFLLLNYIYYNSNGTLSLGLLVTGVTLNTLKRTISRMLLLAVCLGLGTLKKRLPLNMLIGMAIYAVAYFIFSEISEIIDDLQEKTLTPISPYWMAVSLIPVFILDALIFLWLALALMMTISNLTRAGNQETKLKMYKSLGQLLIALFFLSFFMMLGEGFAVGLHADGWWKIWWMWDSYWQFLYWVTVAAVAWIWRPNPNNERFAYSELSVQETSPDDDETAFEMENMQTSSSDDAFPPNSQQQGVY